MIARQIKRLFQQMVTPGNPLYLGERLGIGDLDLGELPTQHLPLPLPRACENSSPDGPASITLKKNTVTGLNSLKSLGEATVTNRAGNYLLQAGIQLAGPPVPAFPDREAYDKYGIVGPLKLDGIIDFTGIKAVGDFAAIQKCANGGETVAGGKYLCTINPIEIQLEMDFIIPEDDNDPIQVKIYRLEAGAVALDQVTLTLLKPDMSLPMYCEDDLPDYPQDYNYFYAQEVISFPPRQEFNVRLLAVNQVNSFFNKQLEALVPQLEKRIGEEVARWI